jgi:hypothetical protein
MQKVTPSHGDYIVLNHDTHYQTTHNLTSFMLDYLRSMNFSKSVTVGQCMGDPPENWYRKAGGAPNATLLVSDFNHHPFSIQFRSQRTMLIFIMKRRLLPKVMQHDTPSTLRCYR